MILKIIVRRDEALPRLGTTTIHPNTINHPDNGDEAAPRLYGERPNNMADCIDVTIIF